VTDVTKLNYQLIN